MATQGQGPCQALQTQPSMCTIAAAAAMLSLLSRVAGTIQGWEVLQAPLLTRQHASHTQEGARPVPAALTLLTIKISHSACT